MKAIFVIWNYISMTMGFGFRKIMNFIEPINITKRCKIREFCKLSKDEIAFI